jgi:hypothetical protein
MIVPNHKKNNYCIYNVYVLIIIIKFYILIEKLCPMVKIFIPKFYNNIKIMNKVLVILYLKTKYTNIIVYVTHYLLIYSKFLI